MTQVTVALVGILSLPACQPHVSHGDFYSTVVGQVTAGDENCVKTVTNRPYLACFSHAVGSPGECVEVATVNHPHGEVFGTVPVWPVDSVKKQNRC